MIFPISLIKVLVSCHLMHGLRFDIRPSNKELVSVVALRSAKVIAFAEKNVLSSAFNCKLGIFYLRIVDFSFCRIRLRFNKTKLLSSYWAIIVPFFWDSFARVLNLYFTTRTHQYVTNIHFAELIVLKSICKIGEF